MSEKMAAVCTVRSFDTGAEKVKIVILAKRRFCFSVFPSRDLKE